MKQILVVENQLVHFKKVRDGLTSSEMSILPSDKDFVRFISAVKIYLNTPGYSESYREACWKEIESMIVGDENRGRVDLIIMDIVLGGATICDTGLDLAWDIWEKIDREIPILFLSRSDYSDEKRYSMEKEYDRKGYRYDRLMKGFMGYETLADSFIKHAVTEKVLEMMKKKWPDFPSDNPNQFFIDKIKLFINTSISAPTREGFGKILSVLENREIILTEDDPLGKEILLRIDGRPTYDRVLEDMVNERRIKQTAQS